MSYPDKRYRQVCHDCGVHLDLHHDEDDCEQASSRADRIGELDRMFFAITGRI